MTKLPPISPGEILREEFLAPLGMSANKLAIALDVPANRITYILNARRSITADTAARLGRFFGTSAKFWLNIQMAYDLESMPKQKIRKIEQTVMPYQPTG